VRRSERRRNVVGPAFDPGPSASGPGYAKTKVVAGEIARCWRVVAHHYRSSIARALHGATTQTSRHQATRLTLSPAKSVLPAMIVPRVSDNLRLPPCRLNLARACSAQFPAR